MNSLLCPEAAKGLGSARTEPVFLADFHISLPSATSPDHLLNTRSTPLTHLNSLVLVNYFMYLPGPRPSFQSILIRPSPPHIHLHLPHLLHPLYIQTQHTSPTCLATLILHTTSNYTAMPSVTASDTSDKSRQHKKTMSSASSTSSTGAQQRGSQSPTAMIRETTPESLADADQKTKKRIQNRVAQRTYREFLQPLASGFAKATPTNQ